MHSTMEKVNYATYLAFDFLLHITTSAINMLQFQMWVETDIKNDMTVVTDY